MGYFDASSRRRRLITQPSTAMNNFFIYQPVSLSDNPTSNPFPATISIPVFPSLPDSPNNYPPPLIVLPQSSQLTF